MIDIAELLVEIQDEPPCGPDLTYDAEFLALETAARGKPEQQFGDTLIPAEQPEWRDVEKRATALLARTKDLRVAGMLTHAWMQIRGFAGMAAGTNLLATLLERHWDHVHPMPEDGDYFMRTNALASLDDVTGLVRDLRRVDFLRSSFGGVSVREAEVVATGDTSDGAHKMSLDQLRSAVAEALRQDDKSLAAAVQTRESLLRMRTLLRSKLQESQCPELDNLQSLLDALHGLLPKGNTQQASATDAQEEGVQIVTAAEAPGGAGVLRTREDAIAQLLNVAEFIEQSEPTNPAPLLIRRAVRLMRMGFMDILRELSPDSLSQVETIAGVRPDGST